MAVSITSSISDAVKEYYHDGAPKDLTDRPHPGYAMLKKKLWSGGSPWNIAVKKANTHGKSKTFATAQGNAGSFTPEKFAVTRVKDYVFARLEHETILATKNDAASFFDALTTEIDSAFQTIGNVMAAEFYRDGTGALATCASESAAVVTLTNPADIRHFEAGQYVDFWNTDTNAIVTDTAGGNLIASVNTDSGTFTLTSTPANSGGWSGKYAADTVNSGDSVGYMGDLTDGGSSLSIVGLAGLEAWNPASTGGSLFGVTQSDARLAGSRYNATTLAQTYREAITDFCAKHQRSNGTFNYISMHPENWSEFEKELDTKVEIVEGPSNSFGFRMLMYQAPWGQVKVFADPDCPYGVARGIDYDNLELRTLDQVGPKIFDLDGLTLQRLSDADSFELRIGYFGNMGCTKPNNFGRLILPSAT